MDWAARQAAAARRRQPSQTQPHEGTHHARNARQGGGYDYVHVPQLRSEAIFYCKRLRDSHPKAGNPAAPFKFSSSYGSKSMSYFSQANDSYMELQYFGDGKDIVF